MFVVSEPSCYEKATNDSQFEMWYKAIQREITALRGHPRGQFVPLLNERRRKKTELLTLPTSHFIFSVFEFFRRASQHDRPLTRSISALAFICKVSGPTVAIHEVAFYKRNEKNNLELAVTSTKMTRPTAGMMTDKSTTPRVPSSLQDLTGDHNDLDVLPFLYAELLSQVAEL